MCLSGHNPSPPAGLMNQDDRRASVATVVLVVVAAVATYFEWHSVAVGFGLFAVVSAIEGVGVIHLRELVSLRRDLSVYRSADQLTEAEARDQLLRRIDGIIHRMREWEGTNARVERLSRFLDRTPSQENNDDAPQEHA